MKLDNQLFYLASPYTDTDKLVMEKRYLDVEKASVQLLKQGVFVFSPIAYNHFWTKPEYSLPVNWEFWENYDRTFLERCSGLIVYQLAGWEKSKGVLAEIEIGKSLNLPIYHLDPNLLTNFTKDSIHLFIME